MKNTLLLFFSIFIFSGQASFSQVPFYVPTNGLIGLWPFNGNGNDESGIVNNVAIGFEKLYYIPDG